MNNKLYYKSPASSFDQALPIGNGSLGAMVYGGVHCDKLSLNHDTLWSGIPKRTIRPSGNFGINEARCLTENGDVDAAEDVICQNVNADWSQNYLPLGNLYIEGETTEYENYIRSLDMQNALLNVEFNNKGTISKREYFATNPDNAIAIRYSDSNSRNYKIAIDSQLKNTITYESDRIIVKGECPSNLIPGDRIAEIPCTYDGTGIKFTAIVKVITDGISYSASNCLTVKNSTNMYIYIIVKTSFIDYNTLPTAETDTVCNDMLSTVLTKTYNQIKYDHTNDFSQYYNRTEIDLNCSSNLSTDEIVKYRNNYIALVELIFNYAKYLMISASREGSQAMNLQGIWNEIFQPPWCSSYTLNINTEMNYWPALSFDLAEMQQPLIELAKKLADTGTTTAKEYYDSDGYVSHHVTDLWGMSTICGPGLKKNCEWGFWNMSSAWLLNELFERYKYTNDVEFLKNEFYPMIKRLVAFYKEQLADLNGNKIMLMSTSPENRYICAGTSQALTKYTSMSQELLIVLFGNYVKCCDILNVDTAAKNEIKEIIPKLYVFDVGSKGQLLEWDREYDETDVNHRHVSHLYGVYPGNLFTEKNNQRLYDASRRSLEIRGDDGTGWSIAWKINLWAKFKDGNHSFAVFKKQMEFVDSPDASKPTTIGMHGGTYANLFDAHPPFQIDGNFGAAMGIIQWFLQCEDDMIKILPALPDEMRSGRVNGLMAKGGIKLFIEWEDARCTGLSAISQIPQKALFEVNNKYLEVQLEENKVVNII